mgnify:CR=1 FL=1
MNTIRLKILTTMLMLPALSMLLYSCNMANHKGKEVKVYSMLGKSFEDTLRIAHNSTAVTRMELEIVGNINGRGKLTYSHPPFIREQTVDLQGSINKTIITDWYDESCLIKYEPKDSLVSGEIKINYIVY